MEYLCKIKNLLCIYAISPRFFIPEAQKIGSFEQQR